LFIRNLLKIDILIKENLFQYLNRIIKFNPYNTDNIFSKINLNDTSRRMKTNFEHVPTEFIQEFQKTDLYQKGLEGLLSYKSNTEKIESNEIELINFPEKIYAEIEIIANLDLFLTIQEFNVNDKFKEYNLNLKNAICEKNIRETKKIWLEIMDYTLEDPNQFKLNNLSETIDILIDGYINTPKILKKMKQVLPENYGTSTHLVNTCSLMLGYSMHKREKEEVLISKGLAALYHDIGKIEISQEILQAPRKLTEEEFEIVKSHPKKGYEILVNCGVKDTIILESTLQHHQKVDGSGYPYSNGKISDIAKEIAVVDTYEALTSNRPYKMTFDKNDSLQIMNQYANSNRLDKKVFLDFRETLI
jgi:HD-GYP domain-containing protein (c-di-GMP phosphodiesterase class II)